MFNVSMLNFGWTHSSHKTLEKAIIAARKTGFNCCISHSDNPFKVVKYVFQRRRNG